MKPDNKKRQKRPRRPDGYFGDWERKRVPKAGKPKREFKKIQTRVGRYLMGRPEYRHPRSAMVSWIMRMMKRYGLSIRGMIDGPALPPRRPEGGRLDWAPSGSRLHNWMRRLPLEMCTMR